MNSAFTVHNSEICLPKSTKAGQKKKKKEKTRTGKTQTQRTRSPNAYYMLLRYANTKHTASGIHFRLQSRTFIVVKPQGKQVVFVNLDACMAS